MSRTTDSPNITMRIEQGRLVPISAFDLELLGRWREGAVLNVEPSLVAVRPLEKKYFALLSQLIREADTGWTNTDTAHEAIKLATGFVTPTKKKDSNEWGSRSRHIATFSDGELSEFFELFCGIVRSRFGLDPETLQREAPDTGYESSGEGTLPADDGPSARPIPVGAGVLNSRSSSAVLAVDGVPEAGGALESTPRDAPSARGPMLRQEEWDWLKLVARMLVSATEPGGEMGILNNQVLAIKENLTPASITPEARDVAMLIYRHCRAVTKGDRPLDRVWITSMARCDLDDLRAEAR